MFLPISHPLSASPPAPVAKAKTERPICLPREMPKKSICFTLKIIQKQSSQQQQQQRSNFRVYFIIFCWEGKSINSRDVMYKLVLDLVLSSHFFWFLSRCFLSSPSEQMTNNTINIWTAKNYLCIKYYSKLVERTNMIRNLFNISAFSWHLNWHFKKRKKIWRLECWVKESRNDI